MSQQQGQQSLPNGAEANDDQTPGQVDMNSMRGHFQSPGKPGARLLAALSLIGRHTAALSRPELPAES